MMTDMWQMGQRDVSLLVFKRSVVWIRLHGYDVTYLQNERTSLLIIQIIFHGFFSTIKPWRLHQIWTMNSSQVLWSMCRARPVPQRRSRLCTAGQTQKTWIMVEGSMGHRKSKGSFPEFLGIEFGEEFMVEVFHLVMLIYQTGSQSALFDTRKFMCLHFIPPLSI